MYYKKIVGEKLYLSPACIEDEISILTKWFNEDEDIAYYNGFYTSLLNENKLQALIEKWNEGPYMFSMINKEDDSFMGHITLFNIADNNAYATMGIYLGKKYRKKGIGKEAIKLILEYAFAYLGMQSIHLEVFSYNKDAYNVYKSCGFKECGRWTSIRYFNNNYHDIILMEYLNPNKKVV